MHPAKDWVRYSYKKDDRSPSLAGHSMGETSELSAYDREMLALVTAVRTWRPYLLGSRFVIRTDHQSLHFLWDQTITTETQQKWLVKLLGYDFSIEYKSGSANKAADALSRTPPMTSFAISTPVPQWVATIKREVADNPQLQALLNAITTGQQHGPWASKDGLLLFKGRIYLLPTSPIVQKILLEYHGSTHEGSAKFLQRLRSSFYWQGMRLMARNFIRHCEVCQWTKAEHCTPAGVLQPLPIPTMVWSDLSMDFIDELPKIQGNRVILVVVDRLSKVCSFYWLVSLIY
ncbi:hypothetical protein Dimus_039102 [Dionaea muscipula]